MYPLRDICSGWSGQRTLSRFFADSDNLLMPIFVWKSAFWLGKTCRFVTRFVRGLQQLYSYQTKVTFPRIAGCIPCDHSLEPKGVGQHSVPWLSVALKMELRCRSTEENRMCWDAKKPSRDDGVRDSQLMPNKRSISPGRWFLSRMLTIKLSSSRQQIISAGRSHRQVWPQCSSSLKNSPRLRG
jgi:hypothetical protein